MTDRLWSKGIPRTAVALVGLAAALIAAGTAAAETDEQPSAPPYLLLESTGEQAGDGLPLMRPIATGDPRLPAMRETLARPFLQWVFELGVQSRTRARQRCARHEDEAICSERWDHPAYLVVMEGGNRPRYGLAIAGDDGPRLLPRTWYVEVNLAHLASLVAHEYGHVIMFESLPGDVPDHPRLLSHTTGAITNDITAFSEGWGIHFETLAADQVENAELYAAQHRDRFATDGEFGHGDSLVAPRDLLTFSQSFRRHGCIKENCFAFLPRDRPEVLLGQTPDAGELLWAWTDTSYDPARVRTLEQMAASEGLVATLFYRLATAPSAGERRLPPVQRYAAFFDAFAGLTEERLRSTPATLLFLETLLEGSSPAERRRIARITLEVMHLTPVLDDAPLRYRELHRLGHRLDIKAGRQRATELGDEMERAVERLVADPSLLATAAAPELWLRHPTLTLDLPVFGVTAQPLNFDLNTVPLAFLRTIPGITLAEAMAIVAFRESHGGLASMDDLDQVPGITPETAAAVRAMAANLDSRH